MEHKHFWFTVQYKKVPKSDKYNCENTVTHATKATGKLGSATYELYSPELARHTWLSDVAFKKLKDATKYLIKWEKIK